jgi:hypothetical protein
MKSTGEELIDSLEVLRLKLNTLRERLEKSGVERTAGLRDALGSDCRFFRKSLNLFLESDYIELRDMIKEAHNLFNTVEGK